MAVRVSRGFGRGQTTSSSMFPKMKYIKVTIFTDGMIIKAHNEKPNQKHNYRRMIKFPENIREDVKELLIENQKENPGIINVEVFDTIPIDIGDHLY